MTLGEFRKLTEDLSDDTPICIAHDAGKGVSSDPFHIYPFYPDMYAYEAIELEIVKEINDWYLDSKNCKEIKGNMLLLFD